MVKIYWVNLTLEHYCCSLQLNIIIGLYHSTVGTVESSNLLRSVLQQFAMCSAWYCDWCVAISVL